MSAPEIEHLIKLLSRLPGLGPRSGRRAALHLITRRETVLNPLITALEKTRDTIKECKVCGNLDTTDPCGICASPVRESKIICVVEDVSALWALERSKTFKGRYHVLGGVLSALDGVGPDDLRIDDLVSRVVREGVEEIILATSATVDGQTTAHYIADRLRETGVSVSGLAHGVPVGGELDYLDDGTLHTALQARRPFDAS